MMSDARQPILDFFMLHFSAAFCIFRHHVQAVDDETYADLEL